MITEQNNLSDHLKMEIPFNLTIRKKPLLKIKAKTTHLQKELKALAKAEEIDLRFQQAKELHFRTKYEKYLTRGNFETSLLKKDGFKRITNQTSTSTLNVPEHVPLHKLIYTNGEVDIEKVMCLHLLTVQYTNITGTSGAEKKNLTLFSKRSKPNMLEASALPFYIVEIIHQVETEMKLKLREPQDVFILVNTNLEKSIVSILEVLAIVSPKKLQKLKDLSCNKRGIQEIMIKSKNVNFLAQAKECPLLFDVANYRLEVAQFQEDPSSVPNVLSVSQIRIKDKSQKLEVIQTEIKMMISKYTEEHLTGGESWSMFHKKFCNCKKASSRPSFSSGNAIALLSEDGREFAVVTGTGCHIPSSSSVFYPSLTAIIKSSPRQNNFTIAGKCSRYSLQTKAQSYFKYDQNKIISSLLHKVNNSQRILIGKKVAEFKSQDVTKGKLGKHKLPINKIIEKVFSKESLISFASNTENEEMKLLFQPCCRGGLGIGSVILESEKRKVKKCSFQSRPTWEFEDEVVPQMMKQEESIMNTAHIKQDIFTSETRTKIKQFLISDNPGNLK